MTVGTKSLLFGVHAFWFHPVVVGLAWRRVNGKWPTWLEWVCIATHDIGYFGCKSMDGLDDGKRHPEGGARVARKIVNWFGGDGETAYQLTLYHSSHYARLNNAEPSALCLPDKASILFEPRWFYLLRARLSGEVHEYISNSPFAKLNVHPIVWYLWYRENVKRKLEQHRQKVTPSRN